jgi:ribonuclease BN (tRNA processing enzyme)
MNNNYHALPVSAKDTDILVMHNATPESASGVASWLHIKPLEMGEIAKQAKVKQVVLSHRMQRTLGKERETKQHIDQNYSGPII